MIPGKQYRRACALARFLVCAVYAALLCIAGSVWEGAQRLYPLPQSQSDGVGVLQFTGKKDVQFHARGRLGARTVQTLETCHAKVQFEPFFVVPCSRTSSHQELHIWREDRDGQCRHRRVSRIEVLSTSSLVHRLIEACVSWVDGLPQ